MAAALFDDDFWDSSHEVFAASRAQAPVLRAVLPNGIGVWVICDYELARAALNDPRLGKDATRLNRLQKRLLAAAGQSTTLSGMFLPHMMFRDGPEQVRLRKLVASAFTPRRVKQLQPRVEEVTAATLRQLPRDRPVDLIDRVAYRIPMTVICELLGVAEADREPFRGWTSAMMQDLPEHTRPASEALERYFAGLIEFKRARPGQDLLSALVRPGDDGADRLNAEELMGTCFLLLVAGFETTGNLIGNSVRHLLQDRSWWRAAGHDPGLVPPAVEEILRFDSPVRLATHRVTLQPVCYDGITIPVDEIVFVALQAANRCPVRFGVRADVLDLGRGEVDHLAFGHGPHYCLGAHLGRVEAVTVVSELARRFPRARLAVPVSQLRHQRSAIMNGYAEMPVLLD